MQPATTATENNETSTVPVARESEGAPKVPSASDSRALAARAIGIAAVAAAMRYAGSR